MVKFVKHVYAPFNLMFDSKFIKALHGIVVFVTKHYSVCDIRLKNKNK